MPLGLDDLNKGREETPAPEAPKEEAKPKAPKQTRPKKEATVSKSDSVYVATSSGSAENAKTGETAVFVKGVTRVRDGHWLLKNVPDYFQPVEELVHHDVEQATAAPGEKRGG